MVLGRVVSLGMYVTTPSVWLSLNYSTIKYLRQSYAVHYNTKMTKLTPFEVKIATIILGVSPKFSPIILWTARARLSQEWVQGLMCIRAPILNCPKNLNIFDELKYIMWTYKSVLVGNVSFDSF